MLTKPTLLIDKQKCLRNIEAMAAKAQRNGVSFRPHFKTHQSLEVGRWFKDFGVDKITVSSLSMAKYFADEWNDITVAFPVNVLEIETINELAERIRLNLLAESEESIQFLKEHLRYEAGIFIKIDVGTHRTGLSPDNHTVMEKIMDICEESSLLNFKGFLAHAGHTYRCRSGKEVELIHKKSVAIMGSLKERYKERFPDLLASVGDTPSCSVVEDLSGVDEIRPGNFVYYDLMQSQIGSCDTEQIAVAMACPVVAVHKERNEIVVYGGGVHFSKENMEDEESGTIYGKVVERKGSGWGDVIAGMFVKSLSQEHGVISVPASRIAYYKAGDIVLALPVHSCMTADICKEQRVVVV